jgi:uncharacterized protein (DUF2236 family)
MNLARTMHMLLRLLQHKLESWLQHLLPPGGTANEDSFLHPRGEPALVAADSISWTVFKNPLALFIGGVIAVVLELAEPRMRSGSTHRFKRGRWIGCSAPASPR